MPICSWPSAQWDIFLLQECSITFKDNYKLYEDRWTHGLSVWSGDNKNRSSGVAILLRSHSFSIQRIQKVIGGRLLCVNLEVNGAKFRIVNIYCTIELHGHLETIQTLHSLILCGREVVIGGDFNCIVNRMDRLSSSSTGVKLDSSSYTLSNMIKDFNLTDVFKSKNPLSPGFTWSNGSTSSRIDFLTYFSGVTRLFYVTCPFLWPLKAYLLSWHSRVKSALCRPRET